MNMEFRNQSIVIEGQSGITQYRVRRLGFESERLTFGVDTKNGKELLGIIAAELPQEFNRIALLLCFTGRHPTDPLRNYFNGRPVYDVPGSKSVTVFRN